MASQQRDSARERLLGALVAHDRLSERFDAAVGTSSELGAYVRFRAAVDQVRARQAWVDWIEDENYRGVNAGPFELLSESRELAGTTGPESRGPR